MKIHFLLIFICLLVGHNSLMVDCSNVKHSYNSVMQHVPNEYSIEITYAQDSPVECQALIENTSVKTELYAIIHKQKQEFIYNHNENGNYVTEHNSESRLTIEIVPQIYKNFLNIEIRIYVMIRGCAHGYQSIKTINYDIYKKRIMRLEDLFPDESNYLEKLCTMSRNVLKKKFLEQSIVYRDLAHAGTVPIEGNYLVWQLNDQGLEIIFNPDQVTSACNGEQRIVLNFKIISCINLNASLVISMWPFKAARWRGIQPLKN